MDGVWFGEVRALLHEAPTAPGWRKLCALLEAPEAAVGVDAWLPYAQDLLDRGWPCELREAPAGWLQAVVEGSPPPAWPLVRSADLRRAKGDAGVMGLIEARALVGLEGVALEVPRSVEQLARALWQPRRLLALSLSRVGLDEELGAVLVGHPGLERLVSLELSGVASYVPWLPQLLVAGERPELRALRAERLYLGGALASVLRSARSARALRALELVSCQLSDVDVVALLESGALASVERLELGRNQLGDGAARSLAEAALPALRELSLENNSIGDAGAQALASAPWASRLEVLDLDFNVFGADGRRALYESEGLAPGLRAAFGASGGMGFGI